MGVRQRWAQAAGRGVRPLVGLLVAGSVLCACSGSPAPSAAPVERVSGGPTGHYVVAAGIHKIKHVIIIEQENRSFDSYFGTYPGADGIPMKNGVPTACVPMPAGGCQAPYHDTADVNGGGPHGEANATADVDGGKMDGFITAGDRTPRRGAAQRQRRQPGMLQLGHARRDGLPHGGGDPELLDLRQGLRARRPHVRAGRLVVAARPPLPGLGLVGQVLEPQPVELRQRHHGPLHPGADAEVRGPGHRHRHGGHHRRLDRHHLAPLQQARLVGLLRADRGPARLRRTTRP